MKDENVSVPENSNKTHNEAHHNFKNGINELPLPDKNMDPVTASIIISSVLMGAEYLYKYFAPKREYMKIDELRQRDGLKLKEQLKLGKNSPEDIIKNNTFCQRETDIPKVESALDELFQQSKDNYRFDLMKCCIAAKMLEAPSFFFNLVSAQLFKKTDNKRLDVLVAAGDRVDSLHCYYVKDGKVEGKYVPLRKAILLSDIEEKEKFKNNFIHEATHMLYHQLIKGKHLYLYGANGLMEAYKELEKNLTKNKDSEIAEVIKSELFDDIKELDKNILELKFHNRDEIIPKFAEILFSSDQLNDDNDETSKAKKEINVNLSVMKEFFDAKIVPQFERYLLNNKHLNDIELPSSVEKKLDELRRIKQTTHSNGFNFGGGIIGDVANLGQKTKVSGVDLKKIFFVQRLFENYKKTLENFYTNPEFEGLKYENFKTNVNNKVSLDSIMVKNAGNDGKDSKYMVVFNGRGEIFEGRIREYCKKAKLFECNVVGFNYRGVINSTGRARKIADLVEDGVSQVDKLIEKGVNPSKIILTGECVGAAIATCVAEKMHQKEKKVYLFNDRSFSSIIGLINGALDLKFEQSGRKVRGRLGTAITKPIVNLVFGMSGWNVNVAKAYKNIPSEYKDYIVVRSTKEDRKKGLMYDDGLIAHSQSLHMALKKERKAEKAEILKKIEDIRKESGKTILVEQAKQMEENLRKELLKFKQRKMEGSVNLYKENTAKLFNNQMKIHAAEFLKEGIKKIDEIKDDAYMCQLF